MASIPGSKRPDPARDQKEALNRALANAAPAASIPTQTSDAASLDTFNGTRATPAAAAAAAGVALVREDNGLNEPGGGSSDGPDGTQSPGGVDEEAKAQEVAERAWENRGDGKGGEQADSPFDFENPALSRLRDEMMGSSGVDEEQSSGPGTAAGRTPPGSSGGATGTNPFTSGVGFDAYSAPGGTITTDDLTLGAVGGGNPLDGDGFFAAQMARVGDASSRSTFPGVADGASGIDDTEVDHDAITDDLDPTENMPGRGRTDIDGPPSDMTEEGAAEVEGVPLGALLGALGPAGRVIGAGVQGWKIGSAINEGLTNLGIADALVDAAVAQTEAGKNEAEQTAAAGKAQENAAAANPPADQTPANPPADQTPVDPPADTTPADDPPEENPPEDEEEEPEEEEPEEEEPEEDEAANTSDQPAPGGDDLGGPPTPAEMAFRSYLRQATNYHGSPGHNEGVTTPTDEPTDIGQASAPDKVGMMGQPVHADDGPTGRRSGNPAILPGDRGDVDPGQDSDTGAWTSNAQSEEPADALNSLGGSGLSFTDARRSSDDDDDEENDDQDA